MARSGILVLLAVLVGSRDATCQSPTAPAVPSTATGFAHSLSSPTGCEPSACDIFVGVIGVNSGNSSYLNLYLEGEGRAYVAMGFSTTRNMHNSDVVACTSAFGTNTIQALDTWTKDSLENEPRNEVDPTQNVDVTLFSGSLTNGRISCSVAKRIVGSDSGQDLNLGTSLYLLYARQTFHISGSFLVQHGFGTASFRAVSSTTVIPTLPPTSQPPATTQPSAATTMPPVTNMPPATTKAPVTTNQLDSLRLTFRTPQGCARSECDIFIGTNSSSVNASYLDITLEGEANGWVAVGFSETQNMFSADVVVCNRNPSTGMVEALDTWNAASGRQNTIDDNQDVILLNGTVENGRIRCTIAKHIKGRDSDTDLDLDNDYFVIYSRGAGSAAGSLQPPHSDRFHPPGQVNPVRTGGEGATVTTIPTTMEVKGTTMEATATPMSNQLDGLRLTFRTPQGCARSECDIFIGTNGSSVNDSYLDITLEGDANGWVAVGFSETQNMFSADVVVCNRNPSTGMVEALDTWNAASGRQNTIDDNQDVILLNGTVENGRIRCTIAKHIKGRDPDADLDLDNDYFVIYSRGAGSAAGSLQPPHSDRFHPPGPVNPVRTGGEGATASDSLRQALTRAHGIFMLIAWMLLGFGALFFATWMQPALPNGEWFQIHRACMVGALFFALLGFTLIFIANKDNPTPGLIDLSTATPIVHLVFGILIVCFQFINPIIALFRCAPDHQRRWIFRVIHGNVIGRLMEAIVFSNIALGLSLFGGNFRGGNRTALWLYLAFIGVYLLYIIVIVVATIVSWRKGYASSCHSCSGNCSSGCDKCKPGQTSTAPGHELKPIGEKESRSESYVVGGGDDGPKPRKPPSRDAPMRWTFFAFWLLLVLPVCIALIVLIAY